MNLHLKRPVPVFICDESTFTNGYLISICNFDTSHTFVVIPEDIEGSRTSYHSSEYISILREHIEENCNHKSSNTYIVYNTGYDPDVILLEENEQLELLILSLKIEDLCKQA